MAHAALATAFTDIPVVMTTSAETGMSPLVCLAVVLTDIVSRPQRPPAAGNHRHVPECANHQAPGRGQRLGQR